MTPPAAQSHLLCFGLGYSARVLCAALAAKGWRISGTSRGSESAAKIKQAGWSAAMFDGESRSADVARLLATATHVLLSVPPDDNGDPVLRYHRDDFLGAPHLQWIGYLSTVGVYGDASGALVDETTPAAPASQRGKRRLAAEGQWLALQTSSRARVEVFRLPGIYGPGRSAIDQLRAGTARRIVKPSQLFNRIHVADIARALEAAIATSTPHRIFNVTDDEPGPSGDVVAYAAQLLGLSPPPEVPLEAANLSAMARSFYGESKRVSNARMKAALGVTLLYPTYREGLAAIAQNSCSEE